MSRLNITINDEVLEEIDFHFPKEKCKTRSEFIENAVKFYLTFLETDNSYEYLNRSIVAGVRQGINDIEKQTMPNIFRLSVELSMLMNVIATSLELDKFDMKRLRMDCVRAVKETNRRCTFENAMKYQNNQSMSDEFFQNFKGTLDVCFDESDYDEGDE